MVQLMALQVSRKVRFLQYNIWVVCESWYLCIYMIYVYLWDTLYKMLAQNMLRTYDINKVFFEKKIEFDDSVDVTKCL